MWPIRSPKHAVWVRRNQGLCERVEIRVIVFFGYTIPSGELDVHFSRSNQGQEGIKSGLIKARLGIESTKMVDHNGCRRLHNRIVQTGDDT